MLLLLLFTGTTRVVGKRDKVCIDVWIYQSYKKYDDKITKPLGENLFKSRGGCKMKLLNHKLDHLLLPSISHIIMQKVFKKALVDFCDFIRFKKKKTCWTYLLLTLTHSFFSTKWFSRYLLLNLIASAHFEIAVQPHRAYLVFL